MLDVLLAIKNNNMSKIPDYDPDLVDRLRKLQRALLRSGSSITELKISLNDLLNGNLKEALKISSLKFNPFQLNKEASGGS